MYSKEVLELVKPSISVSYRADENLEKLGDFDEVPKDAMVAKINQKTHFIKADGRLFFNVASCYVYVGEEIDIHKALGQGEKKEFHKEMSEMKENDITKAVIVPFSEKQIILPVGFCDKVVSTNEELASAVQRIKHTFDSLKLTVENNMDNQYSSEQTNKQR